MDETSTVLRPSTGSPTNALPWPPLRRGSVSDTLADVGRGTPESPSLSEIGGGRVGPPWVFSSKYFPWVLPWLSQEHPLESPEAPSHPSHLSPGTFSDRTFAPPTLSSCPVALLWGAHCRRRVLDVGVCRGYLPSSLGFDVFQGRSEESRDVRRRD